MGALLNVTRGWFNCCHYSRLKLKTEMALYIILDCHSLETCDTYFLISDDKILNQ